MTSDWIFESELTESLIGVGIGIFVGVCGLFYFLTKNYVDRDKDDRKLNYKPIYFAIVCFGFSIYLYITDYSSWDRFSKNRIETEGRTIAKRRYKQTDYIKFKYYVNGREFISERHNICYGQEIKGIECPNGKYVVVYNKLDPTEAVIDFKREIR